MRESSSEGLVPSFMQYFLPETHAMEEVVQHLSRWL